MRKGANGGKKKKQIRDSYPPAIPLPIQHLFPCSMKKNPVPAHRVRPRECIVKLSLSTSLLGSMFKILMG